MMRPVGSIERAAVHQIPWADRCATVRLSVRIVVVVTDAERGVGDLVANGVDALTLRDSSPAGVTPRPDTGHPTRPRQVSRRHPSLFRRVGVAPFAGDVVSRLELHLAEFLPRRRLVIASVDADDEFG